jgi:hypothetical protein
MIVGKVWKLTNTLIVGLDARSSHAQRQPTFPDNVLLLPPLSRCVTLSKFDYFFVFLEKQKKMLSFCDNKYFPSWKDDALGYLSMDLKFLYVQPTQGGSQDSYGQVKHRSDLDELLGMSTTSMDFDVASVEGEAQVQAYMEVQQVSNDTDSLMWWNQYQQEFPDLARMTRQYLPVPVTSASAERFFSRVGLVQTDLRGRLLDTTMIDLMWAKQAP